MHRASDQGTFCCNSCTPCSAAAAKLWQCPKPPAWVSDHAGNASSCGDCDDDDDDDDDDGDDGDDS